MRLRDGPGCARHAFDAAGDVGLAFAGLDRAHGGIDCRESGGAQAVEGDASDFDRKACQQQGHARNVAIVLAGLVGAAEVHLLDDLGRDAGATQHLREDKRSQIIGADVLERAAVATDGRAHRFNDDRFGHDSLRQ